MFNIYFILLCLLFLNLLYKIKKNRIYKWKTTKELF